MVGGGWWLVGWLVAGWLVGWLVAGWLAGWLVGWLVGWLAGIVSLVSSIRGLFKFEYHQVAISFRTPYNTITSRWHLKISNTI